MRKKLQNLRGFTAHKSLAIRKSKKRSYLKMVSIQNLKKTNLPLSLKAVLSCILVNNSPPSILNKQNGK